MRAQWLFSCLLALVLASAGQPLCAQSSDAGAYKPLSEKPAQDTPSAEAIVRETEDYGAWLLRVYRAVEPADTVLRDMQGEWQRANAAGSPQLAAVLMRPFLARARAVIAQSQADLAALDVPRFEAMGLSDDLQPAVVRDQMRDLLMQYDELMVSFGPLMQALIDRDERAGTRATQQMLRSVRSFYAGQRLLSRTQLALADEGSVDHLSIQFDIAFFETGIRAIDAGIRLTRGDNDPTVGTDMIGMADRIDRIIGDAVAAAVADKAANEQRAAEAPADTASVLRERSQRIDAMSNEAFGVWRRFSATVRAGSEQLRTGAISFRSLTQVTSALAPTRAELDAIALRQIEVLAGER